MAKKKKSKIAVLGAGSWGITLGNLLHQNGNEITLWEFNHRQAERLKRNRSFISLNDFKIPHNIKITNSLPDAVDSADYVLLAVPSTAVETVAKELSKIKVKRATTIISAVKGFDQRTLKRPTQVLRDHLGRGIHIAVISGPSHAEEVIKNIPTAVVVASVDFRTRLKVQRLFSNLYFRVYTSSDIVGVELSGTLKNVIAIASGIASGGGMGDNTRAALITRGNMEITSLGVRMGARRNTFNGLSGIGDLIVTCFSEHSRNFRFGRYIGLGLNFQQALNKMETTVEGIATTRSVHKLSKIHKVRMPVCEMVYKILFKNKAVDEAWRELMLRPLRSED